MRRRHAQVVHLRDILIAEAVQRMVGVYECHLRRDADEAHCQIVDDEVHHQIADREVHHRIVVGEVHHPADAGSRGRWIYTESMKVVSVR